MSAQGHPAHQIPIIPSDLLERPITLRSGLGSVHDQAATKSDVAQELYDQGLACLHDFLWIDAARSFHQAARLDPQLALAFVGLSYAYTEVNQPAAARRALERARSLAGHMNEHDRRHLDVRERQLAAIEAPQDAARLAAYRQALDTALATYSLDAELWLLRGMAESPDPSDRGQGSPATAIRFYERALMLVPNHFAAHHYLTHANENSGRTAQALDHGGAYAKWAPNVPHARHMYGHALRRMGRIEEAIAEFEAADRLDRAYVKFERIPLEYDWHYEHNLGLLALSYQYSGQIKKAEPLLKTAFALPTANLAQAVNKREYPQFLRSRARADEALAAAQTLITHPNLVVQATGHIEAGYARLAKRQFAEAAAASNAALAALKRAREGQGLAAIQLQGLQGEFLLRTGQPAKGGAMLDAMVKKARAAQGPDDWSQTLFTIESVARAAREVGDWELAGRMAQQMLEHDPAYAGTHHALALAADHRGDRRAAAAAFALAEKHWQKADPDLAELAAVRAWRKKNL